MHELSIALSIVDAVREALVREGGAGIDAVYLKLGPLSGVSKDALLFSYDAACAGTPLEGSRLVIQDVPVRIYCGACQAESEPQSIQVLCCPRCGAPAVSVLQGRELEVSAFELVEAESKT